tara:strand:+ start:2472 stop:2897 length:426 start_codon:yes stop_codon:yes gene_type:complete
MAISKSSIKIKPLKQILLEDGDVFHGLKASEEEFYGFEEAYFSTIKINKIKAWKRHLRMTMNLIVPVGEVQFNFYNDEKKLLINTIIGERNYSRITVPPLIWFGFKGLSSRPSYILNISDKSHDPSEVEREPLSFLNFLSN